MSESVITAILPGRRRGRFNIYVDSEFAVAAGEKTIADLGLRVGREFASERLAEVTRAEEVRRATEAALRLLEVRARSTAEIAQALRRRGWEPEIVEPCLVELRRIGLINDAEFARQWLDSRSRLRPRGARALRAELIQKGVGRDEIDQTLESISPENDLDLARRAIAPKLPRTPPPAGPVPRRAEYLRLASFLQRRGFTWSTIKIVLADRYGKDDDAD